jgi:hypothetical protein
MFLLRSFPNCVRSNPCKPRVLRLRVFPTTSCLLQRLLRSGDADLTHEVFILPFFVIMQIKLKRPMRFAVYSTLSLGAVDLAFSLTRFLAVQTSNVGDMRSFTTIGMLISSYMFFGAILSNCVPRITLHTALSYKCFSTSTFKFPLTPPSIRTLVCLGYDGWPDRDLPSISTSFSSAQLRCLVSWQLARDKQPSCGSQPGYHLDGHDNDIQPSKVLDRAGTYGRNQRS